MSFINAERMEEILAKTCAMIRESKPFREYMASMKARRERRMRTAFYGRVSPKRPPRVDVMMNRKHKRSSYLTRNLPIERIRQLAAGG